MFDARIRLLRFLIILRSVGSVWYILLIPPQMLIFNLVSTLFVKCNSKRKQRKRRGARKARKLTASF